MESGPNGKMRAITFRNLDKILSPELGVFNRIISFVTFRELVRLDSTSIKGLCCVNLIPDDYFNQWRYIYSSQLSWLIRRRARITGLRTIFDGPWKQYWNIEEQRKMQRNMEEMFPLLQSLEIGIIETRGPAYFSKDAPAFVQCPDVYDDYIIAMSSSTVHESVKTLKLTGGFYLSDDGIKHLQKVFPSLEHLSIPRSWLITCGLAGLRGYRDLRVLNLESCATIDDDGMHHLNMCSSLEDLNINHCNGVSDAGMKILVQGSEKKIFRRLLFYIKRVTDVGVLDVASQCPKLQHICAANISGVGFEALAACCKDLRSVKFSDGVDWKCLPHLATDGGLTALSTGCKNLDRIMLNAGNITYAGLNNLGACLHSIILLGCIMLTDEGLLCLAERCPKLRMLDLVGCNKITDAGLLHFTCPDLQHINVSSSMITDTGIHSLVTGSPCLQEVFLNNCQAISDVGVECIVNGCLDVRTIYVSECHNVSKPWKRIIVWNTGRPLY